ncbi:PREDICTED: LOW QUALITY PROTEIN: sentrin-specific protease 2 [Acanthisitta chloris]|uniref:LOW QUALITY PROTEIN: sentrin-specific protease 2 n=1 Tax=Acanthisitta chloris TaxID=57068 RepID=UPI0004F0C798|nr:PREDICTED: LOW QUALITY PROTEIN: sentrin-specific protease 2 [Acanthisitta chloris]
MKTLFASLGPVEGSHSLLGAELVAKHCSVCSSLSVLSPVEDPGETPEKKQKRECLTLQADEGVEDVPVAVEFPPEATLSFAIDVFNPSRNNHYIQPAPDSPVTPRPPIKEPPVPIPTSSGAGRPLCAAEEVSWEEGNSKYKEILNALKEKYSGRLSSRQASSIKKCQMWRCFEPPAASEGSYDQGQSGAEVSQGMLFPYILTPVLSQDLFFVDRETFPSSEERTEDFAPLTEAMETEITAAFGQGEPSEILSSAFKLQVTREDICTLQQLCWLNDEIINFYMSLLVDRSKKEGYPVVHAFSTFFYPKLCTGGYKAVKRWTRGVDVFQQDLILVPIHLRLHWTLLVIDVRRKTIKYFDSLGQKGDKICETFLQYLQEESREKKNLELPVAEWTLRSLGPQEIPQQTNGSDCGVFVCKFADSISRDKPITFTQEHMPYFRRRMVWEIIHQQLL